MVAPPLTPVSVLMSPALRFPVAAAVLLIAESMMVSIIETQEIIKFNEEVGADDDNATAIR